MSEENVEIVRRIFRRWNAGEREVETEVMHPDLVVISSMTNAEYRGYEGLRRWIAEIDDQFEVWSLSIDKFLDAPGDRLLALGMVHIQGRTSEVVLDQPMAWLLSFSGGRAIELQTIPDHSAALKAAGLSE
jgi:ketosteroid isomerase-like protein